MAGNSELRVTAKHGAYGRAAGAVSSQPPAHLLPLLARLATRCYARVRSNSAIPWSYDTWRPRGMGFVFGESDAQRVPLSSGDRHVKNLPQDLHMPEPAATRDAKNVSQKCLPPVGGAHLEQVEQVGPQRARRGTLRVNVPDTRKTAARRVNAPRFAHGQPRAMGRLR
jgi:hypothetical protein